MAKALARYRQPFWRFAALPLSLLALVGVCLPPNRAEAADLAPEIAACTKIAVDAARLRCFDQAVGLAGAGPKPPPVAGDPGPTKPASSPGFRVDIGYHRDVGDYAGRLHALSGPLNIDSGLGSSGGGLIAELWMDGWPWADISIGTEYLHLHNRGKLSLYSPHGISVLTDPVTANANYSVKADLAFINIAWRPLGFTLLRPVVGAGMGVGRGQAGETLGLSNAFIGNFGDMHSTASFLGGVQGFAGVDLVLGDTVTVSLIPRVLWASAHPFGRDQRYTDYMIGSTLGIGF